MGIVARQSDKASCGHTISTGSPNVLINGLPCARVLGDAARGIILGPGAIGVKVNGLPVALVGDAVASHPDSHTNVKLAAGSPNVTAS